MEELTNFEERIGNRDLVGLIRYTLKFGASHLVNPNHGYSFRTAYDLDLKAMVLIVALLIVKIFLAIPKIIRDQIGYPGTD